MFYKHKIITKVILFVLFCIICVVLFVIRDVLLLIVMFYVLLVNVYCHRVPTQLQLKNISISISIVSEVWLTQSQNILHYMNRENIRQIVICVSTNNKFYGTFDTKIIRTPILLHAATYWCVIEWVAIRWHC
jgi:energy-coupling factor transporter transmembrane protein EcfT